MMPIKLLELDLRRENEWEVSCVCVCGGATDDRLLVPDRNIGRMGEVVGARR